jgi:hypothetical protein
LAGVVDLRGGLRRIDAHSADWIFGQFRFPFSSLLATRNYFVNFTSGCSWFVILAQMRVDHFQEFVVHGFGFFFFVAAQGFGGAMVQVVAHQIAGYAAEGFLDAGDLRDDVGAVAIVFDHFLEAADLAFDAAKAVAIGVLELGIDGDCLSGFAGDGAGAVGG